jgi:UDP-3-O-[3-hydroxymyristoyl] glucosamine N-acyltransferase
MNVELTAILAACRAAGLAIEGEAPAGLCITGIAAVQDATPGDLVFADKAALLPYVLERAPAVVVASRKLRDALAAASAATVVLYTGNVALAHAFIKQRFAGRDFAAAGWEGPIHPSAVVHPSAQVDPSATVEPRAVIGRNTRIGARCRIMAGAVIEHDVTIGDDSIVHPNAVVGYGCRIGREVVIGPGSIVGSEGFGFAQDAQRRSHLIPQTGIVVIEDRVRLGANNTIDRATYAQTRIGAGTKFDNLCHVAHNVDIGEDCLLTAMFCIAGSSRVGNRVMASGQTGIIDHVAVCDDVVLVHRAGVVKDITAPGVHAALPAQPLDEYLRNAAASRKGAELRRRVAELEKSAAGAASPAGGSSPAEGHA